MRILVTRRSQTKPWAFRGDTGDLSTSLGAVTPFSFSGLSVFVPPSLATAAAVCELALLVTKSVTVGLAFDAVFAMVIDDSNVMEDPWTVEDGMPERRKEEMQRKGAYLQ